MRDLLSQEFEESPGWRLFLQKRSGQTRLLRGAGCREGSESWLKAKQKQAAQAEQAEDAEAAAEANTGSKKQRT